MAELLEAVMLVSFGLSWPISVMKNIRARSAKSMSLGFTLLIIAGYVSGITAKIISGKTNYVLAVYIINLLIVSDRPAPIRSDHTGRPGCFSAAIRRQITLR